MNIKFGSLCPPLKEQIPKLSDEDAERFQSCADAISRLYINGIMTNEDTRTARRRLAKLIARAYVF